jgi:hypothetical protein
MGVDNTKVNIYDIKSNYKQKNKIPETNIFTVVLIFLIILLKN